MRHSADYGARALRRLADALEDADPLAADYASFLVEKARSNAASRPTPQSALVADSLVVSGNSIRSAGTPADAVAASSEFGSDLYPQFHHTHTAEGLWLYPAAEDSEVLAKADESLNDLVEDVI
jgi:hypothetical protein